MFMKPGRLEVMDGTGPYLLLFLSFLSSKPTVADLKSHADHHGLSTSTPTSILN